MRSKEASVLYDAPGRRSMIWIWISGTVFGLLALVGAYFFVYQPLDARGQFAWELWAPLLDPSTPEFPLVWERLWLGWKNTMAAAALAIACSLLLGTGLAVLRHRLADLTAAGPPASVPGWAGYLLAWILSAVTRVFVEIFRGLPVVVTIFFVARALPELGINLDPRFFLVIGLTLYNMVVIGEIIRSGMATLPRGQKEAAEALGLSGLQTVRLILLPQSYRIMLPALISQLVVVLKDTSLGFIISYEEVLRVAGQLIQVLRNPIQTYAVVAVLYILVNYALGKLAEFAQRRIAAGRRTAVRPAPPTAGAATLADGAVSATAHTAANR